MSKTIFYGAISLDGFIAGPQGDMSWAENYLTGDEDYGYASLIGSCSAVFMGRKTFEFEVASAPEMERILPTFVLTEQPLRFDGVNLRGVNFVSGDLREVVELIQSKHPGNLFIGGGAELVDGLLTMGLLDELRLFIVPTLLKTGTRLFKGSAFRGELVLSSTKPYESGLVELTYEISY
jgi:dihydrofolate reductase